MHEIPVPLNLPLAYFISLFLKRSNDFPQAINLIKNCTCGSLELVDDVLFCLYIKIIVNNESKRFVISGFAFYLIRREP